MNHLQTLFQQQYHDLFAYTYRFLTWRISDPDDRDDVVATCLMQAYAKLDQYDPARGNLQQWLTGILRRQVVEYWRHHAVLLELDETLAVFEAIGQVQLNDKLDQDSLFAGIMKQLSADQRAMFALRYIDDLTYEEIAQVIHKEPGAVRNFFSRLHRRLRHNPTIIKHHTYGHI